jgi:hypothetical protein
MACSHPIQSSVLVWWGRCAYTSYIKHSYRNIATQIPKIFFAKYGSSMDTTPTQQWKMPTINTSIDLGDHDRDWFVVISKLGNRSIRANLSRLVSCYVRSHKTEYQEILGYTARKYGLTEQECFQKLLKNESLGNPIENFGEIPPEISDES